MRKVHRLDLTGMTFGQLTVISRRGANARGEILWNCLCAACGRKNNVRANSLKNGSATSCGCGQLKAVTTHGMTGTPTFRSWGSMKQRCLNPKAPDFYRYGARGIKISPEWVDSFENFLADMGKRPPGKSLDRIDVNGDYVLSNCRWATKRQQYLNKRNTRYVEYHGKQYVLYDLAEKFNVKPAVLISRLGSGWSVEKALSTPLMPGRGRKKGLLQ